MVNTKLSFVKIVETCAYFRLYVSLQEIWNKLKQLGCSVKKYQKVSDVFKKTQTFRVSTVQPKGLNIKFSFIRTGTLHTSCARHYTRACFDHFMSMILSSTVQRFFFFTLKKGHIPETFAFFLTLETLYTFIFLYRVSPYHLFFLFNIHLLAVKLLTYFRSPTVSPPSESFPYPPFQSRQEWVLFRSIAFTWFTSPLTELSFK